MSQGFNRREFLKRAAGSAAAGLALASFSSAGAVVPPNDRITVGVIGVGARAQSLIKSILQVKGTEVTAICDAYAGRIIRTIDELNDRGTDYGDYRKILDDPGIDAVVVATPDHLHKQHIIDALKAGKDVYSEKPMTYSVDEGVDIIKAVKDSGRILQVGSQGMSSTIQRKAKEIIQSGRLGQITMIRASYNRNTASGAWIYPIPPQSRAHRAPPFCRRFS